MLPHYVARDGLLFRYDGGVASPPLTTCRAQVVHPVGNRPTRGLGPIQMHRQKAVWFVSGTILQNLYGVRVPKVTAGYSTNLPTSTFGVRSTGSCPIQKREGP